MPAQVLTNNPKLVLYLTDWNILVNLWPASLFHNLTRQIFQMTLTYLQRMLRNNPDNGAWTIYVLTGKK